MHRYNIHIEPFATHVMHHMIIPIITVVVPGSYATYVTSVVVIAVSLTIRISSIPTTIDDTHTNHDHASKQPMQIDPIVIVFTDYAADETL